HHILDDRWCGVESRVARLQIDLLAGSVDNTYLEIDDALFSESGNPVAGPGIQCNEPIAWCHVEDPLVAPVGPVRQPAARELPGSSHSARPVKLGVRPQ